MNKNGFTLIELMIVLAIIGIVGTVIAGAVVNVKDPTVCRAGYVFDRQSGKQIIGQNGGGIPCDNTPTLAPQGINNMGGVR